jgi:hypothetical protein
MTVWVDDAVFFRRDPLSRPTSGRVAGPCARGPGDGPDARSRVNVGGDKHKAQHTSSSRARTGASMTVVSDSHNGIA